MRISARAPVVVNDSFINPLVERFGDVRTGSGVFVAGNTILRADPGRRVCLADRTNVQDNVLILSLAGRPAPRGGCTRRSTSTGARTSLAHQAQVVDSRVGRFTFIGFNARITNSVVSDGALAIVFRAVVGDDVTIGDRAVVVGPADDPIDLPDGTQVPAGTVITTQAQADALRP